MFKILFSTKWIALTLVVLFCVPAFKQLSDWQYRRLENRISFNSAVTKAKSMPPVEFSQLVTSGDILTKTDEWRTVTATGVFQLDQQYLLRKRSLNSEAGLWVVTPFKLVTGQTITVVRGWTAAGKSASESPILSSLTNTEVNLTGRLRVISPANVIEPDDLPTDQRIGINPEYGTAYLELVTSEPKLNNPEISLLPAPALSEGPHRSYAIQWLIFIVMLIGGYIILLRNDLLLRSKLPIV